MIRQADSWPLSRLLLIGPEGSGKSHIAAIWAADTGAAMHQASGLHLSDADKLVTRYGHLIIEDADCVAGLPEAEHTLFHVANLAAERKATLLLTARYPVRDWGLALPDLKSRMEAITTVGLGQPDEALLEAVLVKHFNDRQLAPAPEAISALVRRMDRDLGLARRLAGEIDAEALASGRAVTRPLALAALARLQAEE